ncbi:MAG: T9SS type A sorting domain-containing protein [Bacteroidota bacterium]|nr:T9SS type A sorting domain-containing protein [Bacteroidota bacterium]
MKKILLSAFAWALSFTTFAQSNSVNGRGCGSGILPQQFENWVQGLQQNQSQTKNIGGQNSTLSVFNIPVIVHVIHNNEAVNSLTANTGNNLNAAQIQDQINILNKDYNGTNPDTSLIPAVFKPLLGKCQFNFCLAVVNPSGTVLAEPGIDRINRVAKGWTAPPYSSTYTDATIKPNSIWDPNRYFNIWVSGLSGGLLGYATFPNPGTSGLSGLTGPFGSATSDGVVILNTAFGSIGTAGSGVYNKGRTATHEVGHWLGLRHIWGDGTCATDYCNDTPPAQTSNGGCPTHPYKLGTCSGNTTGEMTMNYMDYTYDACMYMFTNDQKNRAQLIMTNSPMRATLLTSTVCNLPSVGNDIGIVSVASPTYSQVINCTNKINPILNVTNFGSTVINNAVFNYYVNGMPVQTYTWSGTLNPAASTTIALPQISNITNGIKTFSVTVSSPNGGTDNNSSNNGNMQSFSITGSFTLSATSATICSGSSATLTATGGASTYTWNPGAITGTQAVYSPTATTIYTLTGKSGTCINTTTTNITVGGALSISVSPLSSTVCLGGTTTLTASGATTYTWNTGSNATSIVVSPTATSIYTVIGTAGTCSGSKTSTVTIGPGLSLTITPTTPTICSGNTTTLTASGAATYTWNTGSNATSISVSPIGTTIYTITGKTGVCLGSKTTTVTVLPTPTITVNTATICNGGAAILTASGATTYSWSTGATSSSISVSPTIGVTYNVTGSNGTCFSGKTTTVYVLPNPTVTASNATICSGNSTILTAGGATTYSWNTGATTNTVSVSPTALTVYTVNGTSLGCTGTKTIQVTVNTTPTVSVSNYTICSGGSVTILASGAASYSWNTGSSGSSITVSPTVLTVYTVTGYNGTCSNTKTSTVTIGSALSVVITPTNPSVCVGSSTTLTATGATSYTWNTGSNLTSIVVSPTLTSNYSVIGKTGACSGTKTISVVVNSLPLTTLFTTSVSCFGGNNGVITPSTTGTGPFSYTYSPNGPNGLSAGNYTTITQSGNGCKTTNTTTITQPSSSLSGVASATNVLCFGGSTGSAFVIASGGTANYTYTWSPTGGNSSLATGLVAGNYTVTIKDANNCSTVSNVSISQPSSALASVVSSSNTTCASSCNGLASVVVTGGTPVYSYTVLPSGGNSSSASNLCSGTYTYMVKDANNCLSNSVFTIAPGSGGLTVSASATNTSCGGCNDGSAFASSTGTGPFTYLWMPGLQTTQSVSGLGAGCYTVTVNDASSCSGSNTVCVGFANGLSNNTNASVFIKVIPNPTSGEFVIDCNNTTQKQIDIVDVTGRIIVSKYTNLSSVNINITDFASGVYFARITSENAINVLRIIKN